MSLYYSRYHDPYDWGYGSRWGDYYYNPYRYSSYYNPYRYTSSYYYPYTGYSPYYRYRDYDYDYPLRTSYRCCDPYAHCTYDCCRAPGDVVVDEEYVTPSRKRTVTKNIHTGTTKVSYS